VPRVLALDFDGVISNSAPEAFVVAMRTWAAVRSESRSSALAESLSGDRAPPLASVRRHPYFAAFLELMPLGNRAEDYAVALGAIEEGRDLPDQAAYDAYRAQFDEGWLRDYHARFYGVREQLAKSDSDGWHRLMAPYAGFVDVIRRRANDVELCIATAKDRGSVRRLLGFYAIRDLFSEDLVLDKETGVTKTAHLLHLQRHFGCRFDEMTFIDDKVSHLDSVARLGVRCALACWGFNGEREARIARDAGHLVCTLENVESQIFG